MTWRRVAYDIAVVQERMRRGRPAEAADRPTRSRPMSDRAAWRARGAASARRRLWAAGRAEAGRPTRPGRAPAQPALPLLGARASSWHGPRRTKSRSPGQRTLGQAPRPSSSGVRWPARRRRASACRRRRRWPSSARTPSARAPTRPRRSCASCVARWRGRAVPVASQIAIAVALLLAIVAISYRQVVYRLPDGRRLVLRLASATSGASASLVAASALLIDYVLTVSVSTSSAVEQIFSAVPAARTASAC